MLDTSFEKLFILFLVAGTTIRSSYVFKESWWWRIKEKIAEDRENKLDRLLRFFSLIGMQIIPIIYLFTTWLDSLDYHLPVWAGWAGVPLFAAALVLLWKSHADIGLNFSPELQIKKEHMLVTDGIFHYIRHPMYAAHLLWGVAQVLLLQNWVAGLSFLVSFTALYVIRVPREEKMMVETFGDQYLSYMNKTGRIIPRLRK